MADSFVDRLAELPKLPKPALRKLWKEFFETSPSPGPRARLMVPILAYRWNGRSLSDCKCLIRRSTERKGTS